MVIPREELQEYCGNKAREYDDDQFNREMNNHLAEFDQWNESIENADKK